MSYSKITIFGLVAGTAIVVCFAFFSSNANTVRNTSSAGIVAQSSVATSSTQRILVMASTSKKNSTTGMGSIPLGTKSDTAKTMAWIYPGKGVCDVSQEYAQNPIDVLKPQYFSVAEDGSLTLLTTANSGCNGYSTANVADIKAHSSQQFVTVSSGIDGLQALTSSSANKQQAIDTLTQFVATNGFTGVEVDFEDFGSWDASTYTNYKAFLQQLGTALHAQGNKLMIDVPPIGNSTEASYYLLSYSDIAKLPTDYIVLMTYDYQFDQGSGTPIAPYNWVVSSIQNAQKYIPTDRLVIGVPSYAYYGPTGSYSITRTTYGKMSSLAGFSTAPRDASSGERIWQSGGKSYVYVDSQTLDSERTLIQSYGVQWISVWALGGGSPWF